MTIREGISQAELFRHLRGVAAEVRLSGSPEEARLRHRASKAGEMAATRSASAEAWDEAARSVSGLRGSPEPPTWRIALT